MISSIEKYNEKIAFIGIEFPTSELKAILKVNEVPKVLVTMSNEEDKK